MATKKIEKANELSKKINEFTEALNCFEWQPYNDPKREHIRISTNPKLIIEFDGVDGRDAVPLPMNLSDALVSFLKAEIIKGRDIAIEEFENL